MRILKKNRGLHSNRYSREPEEKRFAEAWDAKNRGVVRTLNYLLSSDSQRAIEPSDRERVLAATVIQWLGSSVGQSFLEDLGYRLLFRYRKS